MERVIRLDERVCAAEKSIEKIDRRMQDVESDVSEIKTKMGVMDTKLDIVNQTSTETRNDIQKAQRWFITAIVGMILTVVAGVLIALLT